MKVHLLVGAIACACAFGAQAQYKYIGPDGRVVYSDQPPPASAKVLDKKAGGTPQTAGGAEMPFALQTAMKSFPVTLYTAPNCGAPCSDGRNLLNQRGIPYTEKTVSTQEDAAAFRKAVNSEQLPVLTVGASKQNQFEREAWTAALNAAGYPANNQLPQGYKNPAPTAMAQPSGAPVPGAQTAAGPAGTAPTAPSSPQGAAPAPAGDRPAWFKGF